MSREKRNKKIVQLEREDIKVADIAPRRKVLKAVISFDAYFQMLMNTESRILPHHKAPMRKYAEQQNLKEATREEFDRIFKLY